MTFAAVEQQFLNIQKNLTGLISWSGHYPFDPDVHALFLQELDEVNQQISVLQMQVDEMDTATKDFFTQKIGTFRGQTATLLGRVTPISANVQIIAAQRNQYALGKERSACTMIAIQAVEDLLQQPERIDSTFIERTMDKGYRKYVDVIATQREESRSLGIQDLEDINHIAAGEIDYNTTFPGLTKVVFPGKRDFSFTQTLTNNTQADFEAIIRRCTEAIPSSVGIIFHKGGETCALVIQKSPDSARENYFFFDSHGSVQNIGEPRAFIACCPTRREAADFLAKRIPHVQLGDDLLGLGLPDFNEIGIYLFSSNTLQRPVVPNTTFQRPVVEETLPDGPFFEQLEQATLQGNVTEEHRLAPTSQKDHPGNRVYEKLYFIQKRLNAISNNHGDYGKMAFRNQEGCFSTKFDRLEALAAARVQPYLRNVTIESDQFLERLQKLFKTTLTLMWKTSHRLMMRCPKKSISISIKFIKGIIEFKKRI